jgi:hypothetical protein
MPVQAIPYFVPTTQKGVYVNLSQVAWASFTKDSLILYLNTPGPDGANQATVTSPDSLKAIADWTGVKVAGTQ